MNVNDEYERTVFHGFGSNGAPVFLGGPIQEAKPSLCFLHARRPAFDDEGFDFGIDQLVGFSLLAILISPVFSS